MSERTETHVVIEKRVEEIIKRLKVRRLSEQGMQRGHIKRHLSEANQDISFLINYTGQLARELITARSVPIISQEPILLETDLSKLKTGAQDEPVGAKVEPVDTETPVEGLDVTTGSPEAL